MKSIFHDDLFDGKVALVTGGGTGIGRGIAEALAAHGAKTAVLSRRPEHVEPTAEEIQKTTGRESMAVVADVRQAEVVEAAVARVVDRFGRLDLLVNAAAGNFLCTLAELSPNGYGTVLDIDAKGTWNVTRAAYHAWLGRTGARS